MSPRRTNAGRVALYQEAGTVLRENRHELFQVWGVVLAVAVFVNLLPGVPEYLRGLGTGTLLTFSIAVSLWFVWYGNGLGHRLEGTWAEQWTGQELREATSVLEVVPGLRFDRFDIDHIAIARHGVYLIETKRHRMLYPGTIERDVARAAAVSRTASNFLQKGIDASPPETMIGALLVYWGKAGRELDAREFKTSTGTVTLVGGEKLRTWLDERGNGYIGPDYAQSLARELTTIAEAREQLQAPNSRLIRWFARTG